MININNDLIKKLRRCTNVGILRCKEELIRTDGNIELAIDNIRKSGTKTVIKKIRRATLSGLIAIEVAPNKQWGAILEVNCETDFVAKNFIFQSFVKNIIITALEEKIDNIDILKNRFETQRTNLILKIGENVNIHKFMVLTGNVLSSYIHNQKIGVIISVIGNTTVKCMKHIAMHIASENPKYITVADIPNDVIIRERNVQKEISMKLNKSHEIFEKIVDSRMNKFFREIVLTQQIFIMDTSKTIGTLLNEHNIKIKDFVRFEIGNIIR